MHGSAGDPETLECGKKTADTTGKAGVTEGEPLCPQGGRFADVSGTMTAAKVASCLTATANLFYLRKLLHNIRLIGV